MIRKVIAVVAIAATIGAVGALANGPDDAADRERPFPQYDMFREPLEDSDNSCVQQAQLEIVQAAGITISGTIVCSSSAFSDPRWDEQLIDRFYQS